MPSEWAYVIAREQRRDVETMAANLDAAREQGLEEAAEIARSVADGETGCLCEKCLTAGLIESDIRARMAEEPPK